LSLTEGSFTFTGIPHFLWGTQYYTHPPPDTSLIPLLEGDAEVTLSTINDGGFANYETNLGTADLIYLQDNSTATLTSDLIPPGEYFYNISLLSKSSKKL